MSESTTGSKMSKLITITTPDDLRQKTKHALASWAKGGFIERECAVNVWNRVQNAVTDHTVPGMYLAGPMGVGKSSIMYFVVHKAQELNWLVVYIPRCDEWVEAGSADSPAGWYAYFFDAVLAGLKHVPPNIAKKYEYCKPLNHASWSDAIEKEELSLKSLRRKFEVFNEQIHKETAIRVLLAFDESQAVVEGSHLKLIKQEPFNLIVWSHNFMQGCVLVTATADSPYCRTIRGGYYRYIFHVGCLSDKDFSAWRETPQFANVANHPDFTDEYYPEIRSLTGLIPRELVLLNQICAPPPKIGNGEELPAKKLLDILQTYSAGQREEYKKRFSTFSMKYPEIVAEVHNSLASFFLQVHVMKDEVDSCFFDTGLVYVSGGYVVPLNSNATKVFFKVLSQAEGKI